MTAPTIETATAAPGLTMSATSPIRHLCPFKDEADDGTITVAWRTLNGTLELHSLRAYFRSFAAAEISHESITDTIYRELQRIPSVRVLDVSTTWDTAGMGVRCSTSATPAARP